MTSFCDSHDYYKKMLELQEELRKSEEERIRLEERFKILVEESRNRHYACINRLRMRYIEFLEEQRARDERNHKLLEALDRVDSNLALMTAKTDRLNVLRKQYEAYLCRVYATRTPPRSIIDDSDITNRNGRVYSSRNSTLGRVSLPAEIRNISTPQTFQPIDKTNVSVSPSAPELIKSVQSTGYYSPQPEGIQSRIANQRASINQSTLQMQVDPIIHQNGSQHVPLQSITSQISFSRQPYGTNDIQHVPRNFQIDSIPRIPCASTSLQINPLSQQNVRCSNKSLADRMDTVQGTPRLVKSEYINGNVSRHNLVDIPQRQLAPIAFQRYVNPSPVTQSFRQKSNETFLDNLQSKTNSDNTVPFISKAPMERSLTDRSFLNTSLNLTRQSRTNYLDYPSRNSDYYKNSVSDGSMRSLSTPEVTDDTVKRYDRFTPIRSSYRRSAPEKDISKTTKTLENELDRYIDKIRKLHRDYDAQSLEDVDRGQNTIGDNVNAAWTKENEKLPEQEKPNEYLPKEVEKVLALADDLASGTINIDDANDSGKERKDENRSLESIRATQRDMPISERSRTALAGTPEAHATSEPLAKDKISYDIALHPPELDSHENIEKPTIQNSASSSNNRAAEQYEPQSEIQVYDSGVSSAEKVAERNDQNPVHEESVQNEENIAHNGDELNIEQYSFDALEQLEPWNLDDVQKRIHEVDLIDEIKDQSVEEESVIDSSKLEHDDIEQIDSVGNSANDQVHKPELKESTNEVEIDSTNAKDQLQLKDTESPIAENSMEKQEEVDEISASQHHESGHANENTKDTNVKQNTELVDDKINVQDEYDNDEKAELNETNHVPCANENNEQEITPVQEGLDTQGQDYAVGNYVQESDQTQAYPENSEENYTNLNEQYNYDQNVAYENDQNQEYQEYADQEYPNQEYVQESNEQYEGYTSEQYEQYANDPENQYEHDPNMQYVEDPNQQYTYTYDQQYDPNQVYETDANQPFEYTDNYNAEQVEHVQQEPEQSQELEQSQEVEEIQEKPQNQEAEETAELDQSKNEKLSSDNEQKKKKDVIKSLLDSDTDSTIERNVSNTESDFDFN